MIGETIKDFTITARLGRGGMGEVFAAEQKLVKTKVAIKMLAAEISRDEQQVKRFFNEAIAVSKIRHAGIVKIFDVGFHTDGRAYLIMEFLDGETLAARVAQRKGLAVDEAIAIARQVTSVLEATHAAGITHRDLKPDNIFLVPDAELPRGERARILDFGIAKLGGLGLTAAESLMGTPAYMAPELWGDAANADAQTDVYALGCVLYELCVGRPPFAFASISDACAKHLNEAAPRARSVVPALPAALDELIARMLAKRPAERPTTKAVAVQLAAIEAPATQPAATAVVADTVAPPPVARRGAWLAAVGAGVVVVGGVAIYLATRGHSPAEPSRPVAPAVAVVPADAPARGADAMLPASRSEKNGLVLSYRMLAGAKPDDALHLVAAGEELHTGARVAFEVSVSEPAHVFLGQRTKGKALAVLFPDPRIAVANPLPANTWVRIPAGTRTYRLDDKQLGEETIYLIAARKPIGDLAQAAEPRAIEAQVVSVAMAKRPDCAGHARDLTLDSDGDCTVKSRGLELDDEPAAAARGLATGAHRARSLDDDDVVFVPFSYQHLP